jgi:hypothetical protein
LAAETHEFLIKASYSEALTKMAEGKQKYKRKMEVNDVIMLLLLLLLFAHFVVADDSRRSGGRIWYNRQEVESNFQLLLLLLLCRSHVCSWNLRRNWAGIFVSTKAKSQSCAQNSKEPMHHLKRVSLLLLLLCVFV